MRKTATRKADMAERIRQHGEQLLAIFPNAKERDPVKLCKRLRRLESQGIAVGLRLCNGPEFQNAADVDKMTDAILSQVNALLGNVHEYQPKTGAACSCKRGQQRDNCPACEGTGNVIDFRAIRSRPRLVPVFVNRDPRGYALKISDEWMQQHNATLHRDWGGYGIIAPDLSE